MYKFCGFEALQKGLQEKESEQGLEASGAKYAEVNLLENRLFSSDQDPGQRRDNDELLIHDRFVLVRTCESDSRGHGFDRIHCPLRKTRCSVKARLSRIQQ